MQSQSNTQAGKILRWQRLSENYTGFHAYNSGALEEEGTEFQNYNPLENENHKREWEFRVAVLPTRENLKKTVTALTEVFKQDKYKGIDFKCLVLDKENEVLGALKEWDGTLALGKDRDQRGKEICVYMTYMPRQDKYKLTPNEYKELMLSIWKKLLEAKVEGIGYAVCPAGDSAVAVEAGLFAPFTYTAYKPYRNMHGILLQTNFNPYNHPDPLKDVVITRIDLLKAGIPSTAVDDIEKNRNSLVADHVVESRARLLNDIIKLRKTDHNSDVNAIIKKLIEDVLVSESPLQEKSKLEKINSLLPRTLDQNQSLLFEPTRARSDEECKRMLTQMLDYVKSNREEDIKQILADFFPVSNANDAQAIEKNKMAESIQAFLKENSDGITHAELKLLIDHHPQEMQFLYRQLVHLVREIDKLKEHVAVCNNKHEVKDEFLPDQVMENLSTLFSIIDDTEYWSAQSSKGQPPEGVKAMQDFLNDFRNDSSLSTITDLNRVFEQLIKAAQDRGWKPGGLFRGGQTTLLYTALREVGKGGEDRLQAFLQSDQFQQLQKNWRENLAHRQIRP